MATRAQALLDAFADEFDRNLGLLRRLSQRL